MGTTFSTEYCSWYIVKYFFQCNIKILNKNPTILIYIYQDSFQDIFVFQSEIVLPIVSFKYFSYDNIAFIIYLYMCILVLLMFRRDV